MSKKTSKASRLVKKSQIIATESLPAKTPDEPVKATVINNVGETMMNFRRDAAAAKLGRGAGNLVQNAVEGTSNKAMWMIEHVVADSAYLVTNAGEWLFRKSWNSGIALGEAAKEKETENVQKLTAKVHGDIQEVKSLGEVAMNGATNRWNEGYREMRKNQIQRKEDAIQARLDNGEDLRSPWQKVSDRVHQYAGIEEPQAVLEYSNSEPMALPESVATTPMGKLDAQEVAKT